MTATLHPRLEAERKARRLALWTEAREKLRKALHEVIPGERVWLFGSITRKDDFRETSDIDIAIERESHGLTYWELIGEIDERVERPVDVVLLPESRLREKILSTGELWTS